MSYFGELLPSRSDYATLKNGWRHDLLSGVTVGIVALPLALAFGITTGAGAQAGLITAIYAGFIAAIFGGSNFQVSGPTGAMTVVLVPIVSHFGIASLMPLGLVAGALVIIMGLTHCGALINKVPWPVMEGFTLGIAIVIALQQIPSAFAARNIPGSNTIETAWRTLKSAVQLGTHWMALFIVAFTLVIKFSYSHLAKRMHFKVHIPASFVAILLSTLVVEIFHLKVPSIGKLPRTLYIHHSLGESRIGITSLAIGAIEIALLASIESLLSARVADQMSHIHDVAHAYKPNRELVGQGLGTLLSSMVGGMPATGAIARTGVNIRAGGKSRLSAIFHAIFLLIVVLLLSPIISKIPMSALGAVLIGTSYRIASPGNLRELLRTTKASAITLLATALLVVLVGLIWAIAAGVCIYYILHRRQVRQAKLKPTTTEI